MGERENAITRKLTVALIGCGGMGGTHNLALKALSDEMDVEMIAIADCREECLEKGAAVWPGVHKYGTGMELLENESPDIVHICLPSYLHADHAVRAMKKGCHVFIEKPVCLSKEEGELLLQTQRETGVKVMVGQVVRSFAEYRYLKEIYEKQTYGKLKSVVMQRLSRKAAWGFENWFMDEEKSGSVVLDLHIHDLDFLRYMLGEPDSFTVKAASFDTGLINQVITDYQFKDIFAVAEGLWDVSPAVAFEPSFRASFEEATVIYNGTKDPALLVYEKDGKVFAPELKKDDQMQDAVSGINLSDLGPYYTEIRYFLECLRSGKEMRRAPLEEGVKSVLLGLEELEAAREYIKGHKSNG